MYKVVISRSAEKELYKLPKKVLLPISRAIDGLEETRVPLCKRRCERKPMAHPGR
jgi:mRNA-degrading endonuclease RelE of RelBE toxin-antitoxin system